MISRLSTSHLMVGVLSLGIWFAALRSGSDIWRQVAYSATTLALVLSAVAAHYRGPFWYGFAVVGWSYFLLGYSPGFRLLLETPQAGGDTGDRRLNDDLLTSRAIAWVYDQALSPPAATRTNPVPPWTLHAMDQRRANTLCIGHSFLTLVLATLGGQVTKIAVVGGFRLRRTEQSEEGCLP
jgi:hypothetical protein